MATALKYPNAPITEAGIHLTVRPRAGIRVADLARCHEGEEESFPIQKKIQVARGHIEVGTGVSAAASSEHVGYLYGSPDQSEVYKVHLDGFSFSRLAPYQGWVSFRDEARRLWRIYREQLQPDSVTRLAVRYINRLDVPGPPVKVDDYLKTVPQIANDLPQDLEGYFMQVRIPIQEIGGTLLLNETVGGSPKPGCVAIILDIDLFRSQDIPQDETEIWELFDTLRVRKNAIFEACITERARELFQ